MTRRLLLNLRNVPDDEADEVRAFLDEAEIAWYETRPGPLGITAGGIWLRRAEDYPEARKLMDAYQAERFSRQRAEYERLKASGQVETLWQRMMRKPLTTLAWFALALFILIIFITPVVHLATMG